MSSPVPMTLAGRYRVQRKLGEGAFGAVYMCDDAEGGPQVALKVLLAAHRDEAAAARFQREAETALRLRHPRLVSLLDSGVVQGDKPYLAFEYVEGQDLARFLRKEGRPERDQAVRWLRHLCQALGICHAAGIVHRDVKPGNVMLDRQGGALLGDFGLAVREGTARQLTRTGELVGTPLYTSPELLRGERPGAPGDLFSLGAVGYELLYGRPWRSATDLGSLGRDAAAATLPLEDETRLGHYPDLDPWLHRMLAQTPDERYASAREARKALEELSDQRSSEAIPRPARRVAAGRAPSTRTLVGLGAILAVAGVVATLLLRSPPRDRPAPRTPVADLPAYPPELLRDLQVASEAMGPALAEATPGTPGPGLEAFLDPAFPLRVRRWLRAAAAAADEGLDVHVPELWGPFAVVPGRQLLARARHVPSLLPAGGDRAGRLAGQLAELSQLVSEHVDALLARGRRAGVDQHLAPLATLGNHPVAGKLRGPEVSGTLPEP